MPLCSRLERPHFCALSGLKIEPQTTGDANVEINSSFLSLPCRLLPSPVGNAIRSSVCLFPSRGDKWRLHLCRRRHASDLASGQATPLHRRRRRRGTILAQCGWEERGRRRAETRQGGGVRGAGSASLDQSACTPPDNWPISGREARGPERIILGKGS